MDIDEPDSSVNLKLYRGMIGSLLYLTISRPYIIFSVGLCARFLVNPKKSHLTVVERILRYLKGTTNLCLWYPKGSNFNLVGYVDTDYAGFHVDRKSTSGMAHFISSCLVSWATKKKYSMALSTAEAEYVVAASCYAQLIWIKQQSMDFEIDVGCIPIFCDNTNVISTTKNPVHHKRTKHIDVRHHFLRDNYEKGLITVEFCAIDKKIADIFTKALSRDHFERNMLELGMIKIT
ncbi:secreted RxLR effector protein 161-like [Nicotiana tomentosiformis]|uniref:secreted RxLR effector protein 161-like n=1 Tax=Nicotiana tomentosiformis TaxID=4098 RepID=UPI00388C8924